jgi:hypothetical protein
MHSPKRVAVPSKGCSELLWFDTGDALVKWKRLPAATTLPNYAPERCRAKAGHDRPTPEDATKEPHAGGCIPGDLTRSSRRAAYSALATLLSRSSLCGPGGSLDASLRKPLANAISRSLNVTVCWKRRRRLMDILALLYHREQHAHQWPFPRPHKLAGGHQRVRRMAAGRQRP